MQEIVEKMVGDCGTNKQFSAFAKL